MEAETRMDAYVKDCKKSLETNKSFNFAGIGKLILDPFENLQFIPDKTSNFLVNSFGLKTIEAKPIIREKVFKIEREDIPVAVEEESKPNRYRLAGIAASLLIGLLLVQIIFNTDYLNSQFSQIDIGSGGSDKHQGIQYKYNAVAIPQVTELAYLNKSTSSPDDEIAALNAKEDVPALASGVSDSKEAPSGYYIICGSFKTMSKAQRFVERHLATTYASSHVIPADNGYFRAGFRILGNTTERHYKLIDYQVLNAQPDAWLLKHTN